MIGDGLQPAVGRQWQHGNHPGRTGQLVQQHGGQPAVTAVFLILDRQQAESPDQLAQQRADLDHRGFCQILLHHGWVDIETANLGLPAAAYLMLDTGRNPYCPLWRCQVAAAVGVHIQHALAGIGKLQPGMAVPKAQRQIGQGFGLAINRAG